MNVMLGRHFMFVNIYLNIYLNVHYNSSEYLGVGATIFTMVDEFVEKQEI